MNIKFGMDNFYVRYLKRYVNHELNIPTSLLGAFNEDDLEQLIKFLNLPNVKTLFEVRKEIIKKFPGLKDLFYIKLLDNAIVWTSKKIDEATSDYLFENQYLIKEYCESVGWELESVYSWIDMSKDINGDKSVDDEDRKILFDVAINHNTSDYPEDQVAKCDINLDGVVDSTDLAIFEAYLNNGKLSIKIRQTQRTNCFPNKDMLIFINQFRGDFMYNYAMRDGGIGTDDQPHPNHDGTHKIAIYKCYPGQKVTIAHNNTQAAKMIIGSSPANVKGNIPQMLCYKVEAHDGKEFPLVNSGEGIQYQCASRENGDEIDAHWLCIEVPSDYGSISKTEEGWLQLDTGDINFDGRIDIEDYNLLARYTAKGPSAEKYKWTPTPKQLCVMDCRKDHQSPGIDIRDAEYLYRFIQGDPRIPSLGFSYYKIEKQKDVEAHQNVENLLIIDGWYDNDVNIPFADFIVDDWVIHEKFFNYLFSMAIQEYSDGDDITYLQKLLKEIYPEHIYDRNFFYPGHYSEYMREIVKDYQKKKYHYTTGDLNKDGKIDNSDLDLLGRYITDSADYTLVQKYIADPEKYPLSPEEIERLDVNGDGKIDKTELDFYDSKLSIYDGLMRARSDINGDGFVDEKDYHALESIINEGFYIVKDETTGYEKKIDLKIYDIPFSLGWCDVQTEALLEAEVNKLGYISEVSK